MNDRILIFGDVCPTDDTRAAFESGKGESLFGDLLPMIKDSAYCIANLECTITDQPTPIKKCGPVLYGSTKCMHTLADAGINAVSLANNHIRDCGDTGVADTLNTCDQNGIAHFGAGATIEEAAKAHRFEVAGRKFAVCSFCEREFTHITEGRMGGKPLDVFEDYDRVAALKAEVDYLIVLFHGGIENHRYPSPLLQKKCRKFIDSGADLVLIQHSHCIGALEDYHGGKILYGQGNSIFGYRKGNKMWNEGLLVSLKVGEGVSVELLPIETVYGGRVGLAKNPSSISQPLLERSVMVTDAAFIQQQWEEFCNSIEPLYFSMLYGHNLQTNRLNRLLKNRIIRWFYTKWQLNVTNNLIRCDAHREVVETLLNKYLYE